MKILFPVLMLFLYGQSISQAVHINASPKPVTVLFTVDLSSVNKHIRKSAIVGVRGNVAPLSWDNTFILTDADKDGKYEGEATFTVSPGSRISYKYMYAENWERTADRVVVIEKEQKVEVDDKWEYLLPERSAAYHDSIELIKLPQTIFALDSLLFDSYNRCQLDIHASLFSEDIEFYHDRGGLSTSKSGLIEAVRKNICNKIRRELKPGSLEVSPIPGYGAVCIGMHRFHNLVEKSVSQFSKFVTVWQLKDGQWKVTRVISLH
jgi:Domain of unknown function (DUF4440)